MPLRTSSAEVGPSVSNQEIMGDPGAQSTIRKERLLVLLYAVAAAATLAHFVHAGWMATSGWVLRPNLPVEVPPLYAPDAYRVAIPALLHGAVRTLRLRDIFLANAALDFACALLCILLLYSALLRGRDLIHASGATRWGAVAVLLSTLQFPLAWVVPWQRPETMPSAAFVAFGLYCLLRAGENGAWTAALLTASAWQGFVRADVAVVLGLALVLLGGFTNQLADLGTRTANALRGMAITCLAGGAQAWLQFVKHPHLTYPPGMQVVQWRNNLSFHNFETASIALLPLLLCLVLVRGRRVDGFDTLVLTASLIYLVVWYMVGNVAEVRIFVPYMLPVGVVLTKLVVRWMVFEHGRARDAVW